MIGTTRSRVSFFLNKLAVVGILEPGRFFGEGCLNGQTLRIGTARAIEECLVTNSPTGISSSLTSVALPTLAPTVRAAPSDIAHCGQYRTADSFPGREDQPAGGVRYVGALLPSTQRNGNAGISPVAAPTTAAALQLLHQTCEPLLGERIKRRARNALCLLQPLLQFIAITAFGHNAKLRLRWMKVRRKWLQFRWAYFDPGIPRPFGLAPKAQRHDRWPTLWPSQLLRRRPRKSNEQRRRNDHLCRLGRRGIRTWNSSPATPKFGRKS